MCVEGEQTCPNLSIISDANRDRRRVRNEGNFEMKRIIAATAVVLGLAAPAFANSTQLEADLGVPSGEYTTSQLALMHFDQDKPVSERTTYFGGESAATVSSKSAVNPAAEAIFASLDAEDEPAATVNQEIDTVTVYSSAVVNDRAAAIFADIDAE